MKWYQMRWAQKYWGTAAKEKYRSYLNSDAWKAKRAQVLKAAGGKCRRCGARATEVHHETYKRIFNERLSDLTALCRGCHEKEHLKPKRKRKRKPKQNSGNKRALKRKRK